MANNRDDQWHYFWVWESCWFTIFSFFVLSMIIILRPNVNSDMLTQMQEVLDETLTEVTETIDNDNRHEYEMEDMGDEVHNFGKIGGPKLLDDVPEQIFDVDEEPNGGMSMEDFAKMKRQQRVDRLSSHGSELDVSVDDENI